MRKDARCIIDDDRDGHSGEISSAEEFRLVKINSAGAAKWDEACATCGNEHILRDGGVRSQWAANVAKNDYITFKISKSHGRVLCVCVKDVLRFGARSAPCCLPAGSHNRPYPPTAIWAVGR